MIEDKITVSSHCKMCETHVNADSIFCTNCGYPEHGTDKDVAIFHAHNAMEKNKNIDADRRVKSARNTLYVMAGISFVFGLILFFNDQDVNALVADLMLCIIYLCLAYWSKQKPVMALLLGLLLFLTTIILSALFDPSTILKGLLWKILIIVYLGKGIYSASAVKK
jgi:hypothetical protein